MTNTETQTPTPRTDEEAFDWHPDDGKNYVFDGEFVSADFARQLERELAAIQSEGTINAEEQQGNKAEKASSGADPNARSSASLPNTSVPAAASALSSK